jgi:hypothetical protein
MLVKVAEVEVMAGNVANVVAIGDTWLLVVK